MKQFAFIALATLAALFSSCNKLGKEDDVNPDFTGELVTEEDIQGTWVIEEDGVTKTLTLDNGNFSVHNIDPSYPSDYWTEYGTYSYSNGEITWSFLQYRSRDGELKEYDYTPLESYTGKVKSLLNKTIIIIEIPYDPSYLFSLRYGPYARPALREGDYYALIYYKEKSFQSLSQEKIQGKWVWTIHEEECASFDFDNDDYAFRITLMGISYTGKFSCENGCVVLKTVKPYTLKVNTEGEKYWEEYEGKLGPFNRRQKTYSIPFLLIKKRVAYTRIFRHTGIFIKE